MTEEDAIPASPSSASGSEYAQSEDSPTSSENSAASRYSVATSRFSVAPTESTIALKDTGTDTETDQRGYTPSLAESDVTITSAASGRSRRRVSKTKRRQKGDPTLYDCVAGTVRRYPTSSGLYRHQMFTRPYSAADYYFEQLRKKTGDEDEDSRLYWHRELDAHTLPSSDVLWAIHRYASLFLKTEGELHLKFMDESALLAFGVLIEETMKEELDKTGYRAFLESVEESSEEEDTSDADGTEEMETMTAEPRMASEMAKKRKRSGRETSANAPFTQDDFLTDDGEDGFESL